MTRNPDPAVIIRSSDGEHWTVILRNVSLAEAMDALRKALIHTNATAAGVTAGPPRRTAPGNK